MSIAVHEGRRRTGGTPVTLEQYRREDAQRTGPPPPARGTRLTEVAQPAWEGHWRDHAACKGKPTHWWFPPPGNNPATSAVARSICAACPVKEPCRADAVANNDQGIRGDASGSDRRRFRQQAGLMKRKPRGPIAEAVMQVIVDGNWWTYEAIAAALGDIITEERAIARWRYERTRAAQKAGRTFHNNAPATRSAITDGRRLVVRDTVANLDKTGAVQRGRGDVRIIES